VCRSRSWSVKSAEQNLHCKASSSRGAPQDEQRTTAASCPCGCAIVTASPHRQRNRRPGARPVASYWRLHFGQATNNRIAHPIRENVCSRLLFDCLLPLLQPDGVRSMACRMRGSVLRDPPGGRVRSMAANRGCVVAPGTRRAGDKLERSGNLGSRSVPLLRRSSVSRRFALLVPSSGTPTEPKFQFCFT
jgi:hypothetical protein